MGSIRNRGASIPALFYLRSSSLLALRCLNSTLHESYWWDRPSAPTYNNSLSICMQAFRIISSVLGVLLEPSALPYVLCWYEHEPTISRTATFKFLPDHKPTNSRSVAENLHPCDPLLPLTISGCSEQNVAGIGEVSTLEVQTAGSGSWTAAVNRYGAVWELDSIPGSGPYNIQATLNDGSSVCTHHPPLSLSLSLSRSHIWDN